MAAIASRGAEPAAPRSPSCGPTLADRRPRARRRSTQRFPTRARSRARSCPASRRRRPTIDAVVPVDRAGDAARRPERARRLVAQLAPGDAATSPRSIDASLRRCCPQADLASQVRDARRAADRRREDLRRPVHDRRRELQGVLVHDGRPRRRGPELRRQRHVRALPGRRRRPDRCRSAVPAATSDKLFGNAVATPLGTRPAYPGKKPAVQARRACYKNTLPNLNGAPTGPLGRGSDAVKRAIRKHARDFVAIVGLVLVALLVGGYILAHQRFYLPGVGAARRLGLRRLQGEFSTAQAVTPGQGQTVQIAGVDVGEITNVELKDGRAVVGDEDPAQVHADLPRRDRAAAPEDRPQRHGRRARPRHPARGRGARTGFTIPVTQTLPNVNLDEILSALDADTRDYLRSCSAAPARASAATARTCRHAQALRADGALPGADQRAAGASASATSALDPQLQAAGAGARRQGRRARRARRLLQPRLPAFADQDAQPARDAAAAARRARTRPTARSTRSTSSATCSGRRSAPCCPAPARSGRRCSRRARSCARRRRSSRTSCGRSRATALPGGQGAAPGRRATSRSSRRTWRARSRSSTACSTSWPTTRRARRRATSSGRVGQPRRRHALRTQDAHGPIRRGLVLASCSSLRVLEQLRTARARCSARSASCSTRPRRAQSAGRPRAARPWPRTRPASAGGEGRSR